MTALAEMKYGLDVSTYQDPVKMPYADPRVSFVIAKATEATRRDPKFAAHVSKAVAAGKTIGAYHFFHPDAGTQEQREAFSNAAAECGYGHDGDIAPAIDVEDYSGPMGKVSPKWVEPLKQLCDYFEEGFGCKPLLYMGGYTWINMGRPSWVADYPLWVPMYWRDGLVPGTALASRFVPCGRTDWAIWQRYVGPAFGTIQASRAAGAIDQNWAQSLPLISGRGRCTN